VLRAPLKLPTGVLAAETITMSSMFCSSCAGDAASGATHDRLRHNCVMATGKTTLG
jgi:hypothetical protein